MANHSIVLTIDTENIPAAPVNQPITAAQTDANCSFGQTSGTNEQYNVSVENGDTVTWSALNKNQDSSDIAYITEIDYETGIHLFGSDDLKPATTGANIVGTVTNASNPPLVENYMVKFSVWKSVNGTETLWGNYEIDPVITMSASNR